MLCSVCWYFAADEAWVDVGDAVEDAYKRIVPPIFGVVFNSVEPIFGVRSKTEAAWAINTAIALEFEVDQLWFGLDSHTQEGDFV